MISKTQEYKDFLNKLSNKTDYCNSFVIGKSRRAGYSNLNNNKYTTYMDPLYNMRAHCKSLYKEFKMYNMINYKIPFTSEETINFEKMIESKDEYSLQLCKQIILTKLNNE